MNRPYVICHMLTSIDGKTTGNFLDDNRAKNAINHYFKLHQDNKFASFACGRITMEESFTKGYYPDLTLFSDEIKPLKDYIINPYAIKYAVAFDRLGKLGWKENVIKDELECYNDTPIIEVLTEKVDQRYLRYLESKNICYIFAGKDDIDLSLALKKLYYYFNISRLLLEGGSTLNASFLKEDLIDEVSIVVAPLTASSEDKPLFNESLIKGIEMGNYNKLANDVITYNYYFSKDRFININDSLENQIVKYAKVKDILANGKSKNKTFRENTIKFGLTANNLSLKENHYKLNDIEYNYIDINDDMVKIFERRNGNKTGQD